MLVNYELIEKQITRVLFKHLPKDYPYLQLEALLADLMDTIVVSTLMEAIVSTEDAN